MGVAFLSGGSPALLDMGRVLPMWAAFQSCGVLPYSGVLPMRGPASPVGGPAYGGGLPVLGGPDLPPHAPSPWGSCPTPLGSRAYGGALPSPLPPHGLLPMGVLPPSLLTCELLPQGPGEGPAHHLRPRQQDLRHVPGLQGKHSAQTQPGPDPGHDPPPPLRTLHSPCLPAAPRVSPPHFRRRTIESRTALLTAAPGGRRTAMHTVAAAEVLEIISGSPESDVTTGNAITGSDM